MTNFSLPHETPVKRSVLRSFTKALLPVVLVALAKIGSANAASTVSLAWNTSPDPTVTGYHLYQGGASGVYTNMVVAGSTNVTVNNLVTQRTYYFAVTAFDAIGLESPYSNEIAYTVPVSNAPPVLLTSCHRLPTGNYSISGTAAANQTCVLEAAPNLNKGVSWTFVVTNTANASGAFTCNDLKATNYPVRFYRVLGR